MVIFHGYVSHNQRVIYSILDTLIITISKNNNVLLYIIYANHVDDNRSYIRYNGHLAVIHDGNIDDNTEMDNHDINGIKHESPYKLSTNHHSPIISPYC
jgi:hypothetical protein